MNGEVFEMCEITLHARRALKRHEPIPPLSYPYVAERRFVFSESFGSAGRLEDWLEVSRKRGVIDLKFLIPTRVEQRGILGFANTSNGCIVLFRKDQKALVMAPCWEYLPERRAWKVRYREEVMKGRSGIPEFTDPAPEFDRVLEQIRELALKIQEPGFADLFLQAREILAGKRTENRMGMFCNEDPERRRYLDAASLADVFGAMGSWNDCPPGEAAQLGLSEEYEALSQELLRQLRLSIMYGVNHDPA